MRGARSSGDGDAGATRSPRLREVGHRKPLSLRAGGTRWKKPRRVGCLGRDMPSPTLVRLRRAGCIATARRPSQAHGRRAREGGPKAWGQNPGGQKAKRGSGRWSGVTVSRRQRVPRGSKALKTDVGLPARTSGGNEPRRRGQALEEGKPLKAGTPEVPEGRNKPERHVEE